MGAAASITLANFGAAYGTAKSGVGIMAAGVLRPDNMVKSMYKRIDAHFRGNPRSAFCHAHSFRPSLHPSSNEPQTLPPPHLFTDVN